MSYTDDLVKEIAELKTENKALLQRYWADMNTARCVLLNRIEDLTALTEDMRLKELEIKKALNRS